ncbi:MAG: hypothetical protein HOE48_24645 [Candidatus Latescibacteria bacterium]|jgi:hypothetical protein|nr:hypothetical protein [Candidatus Latescibacterota bacterium]MBT4141120.1 hypothetical protein [Candidatus Latescibacterota bacterium]MBT5831221.1 hypothetical protein [Candidatus Latescibacterota bacterium]
MNESVEQPASHSGDVENQSAEVVKDQADKTNPSGCVCRTHSSYHDYQNWS